MAQNQKESIISILINNVKEKDVEWGSREGGACICGNVINPTVRVLQVCGILPQTADSGHNPTKREKEGRAL